MSDLVGGGVEPERKEWAAGQLASICWTWDMAEMPQKAVPLAMYDGHRWTWPGGFCFASEVTSIEPLDAVPTGFGERLAQAIEKAAYCEDDSDHSEGLEDGMLLAAALVRREFTQPVSPETNGEQK